MKVRNKSHYNLQHKIESAKAVCNICGLDSEARYGVKIINAHIIEKHPTAAPPDVPCPSQNAEVSVRRSLVDGSNATLDLTNSRRSTNTSSTSQPTAGRSLFYIEQQRQFQLRRSGNQQQLPAARRSGPGQAAPPAQPKRPAAPRPSTSSRPRAAQAKQQPAKGKSTGP